MGKECWVGPAYSVEPICRAFGLVAHPLELAAHRPCRRSSDSPLEGDGFELPVPREIAEACRRHEQTVAILRPGDHRKVMDHLWAPTSGPDLWPLTARTVFQPLKPSSPPQPFRAV